MLKAIWALCSFNVWDQSRSDSTPLNLLMLSFWEVAGLNKFGRTVRSCRPNHLNDWKMVRNFINQDYCGQWAKFSRICQHMINKCCWSIGNWIGLLTVWVTLLVSPNIKNFLPEADKSNRLDTKYKFFMKPLIVRTLIVLHTKFIPNLRVKIWFLQKILKWCRCYESKLNFRLIVEEVNKQFWKGALQASSFIV